MGKLRIVGGKRIKGSIEVQRAKNAVLPFMAAALLTEDEVIIKKCPKLTDVCAMAEIINSLGASARFEGRDMVVSAKGLNNTCVQKNLCEKLRASSIVSGALTARTGSAELFFPGGCKIGARPLDIHLDGLEKKGAFSVVDGDKISIYSSGLKGGVVYLPYPSVGATENIMIASATSDGETVILNAAREPEIVDLADFLSSMGAKIKGAGTDRIVVEGVKSLHGTEYTPIGDRIEAGTYIIAALVTGGEIEIGGVERKNILPFIDNFYNNTCNITCKNDIIRIQNRGVSKGFGITAAPYPSFPTDLQPQATALATVSDGVSVITETVFENRFTHVPELVKMGADIRVNTNTCVINGVRRLKGANVSASDLRCGAALVIAALNAEGETTVDGMDYIERGYERLPEKLTSLGADVSVTD